MNYLYGGSGAINYLHIVQHSHYGIISSSIEKKYFHPNAKKLIKTFF